MIQVLALVKNCQTKKCEHNLSVVIWAECDVLSRLER